MSATVVNHVSGMLQNSGKTLRVFGKDQTELVSYQFNHQGFRSTNDFDFVPDHAFFGCSLVFGIGVDQNQTFPYLFNNSHNYGLAGTYDNHDIMTVLEKFLSSSVFSLQTKIAVVWHSRDSECLEQFYDRLKDYNIEHFYCGTPLTQQRCYAFPRQLDQDVSGTHPGPKLHKVFSRMLCDIFNQS